MNTTEAEIKAVAKAIGASLLRQGHSVPNSHVLNAVAAALNKRSWQTLKAGLSEVSVPNAPKAEKPKHVKDALVWKRALHAAGVEVPAELDSFSLISASREYFRKVGRCTFAWRGWVLPAFWDIVTGEIETGDFVPSPADAHLSGVVSLRLGTIVLAASAKYDAQRRAWTAEVDAAQATLAGFVTDDHLAQGTRLGGSPVMALVQTDDSQYAVKFDLRKDMSKWAPTKVEEVLHQGHAYEQMLEEALLSRAGKTIDLTLDAAITHIQSRKIGFKISVPKAEVLEWFNQYRLDALNLALCGYFEIELEQAQEEEIRGMWDWLGQGEACECSFDTLEEAAANAVRSLGLYEKALQG